MLCLLAEYLCRRCGLEPMPEAWVAAAGEVTIILLAVLLHAIQYQAWF